MTEHPDKFPWRYRRHLPHINSIERPLYITFSTKHRWILPESVRDRILKHCIHDHNKKFIGCCAIVMPDHVHIIMRLLHTKDGTPFSQAEILKGIKGSSANSINNTLNRTGPVWEEESFDRENLCEKIEYVWQNPVRKGLAKSPEQYPWFSRRRDAQ